mmetsp:Transcript_59819/g.192541  ORF Transcript_59819/g.192541 Transcript_59819/m.192541 type:complete len:273 (-) Transcript_59819:325-1143(-)
MPVELWGLSGARRVSRQRSARAQLLAGLATLLVVWELLCPAEQLATISPQPGSGVAVLAWVPPVGEKARGTCGRGRRTALEHLVGLTLLPVEGLPTSGAALVASGPASPVHAESGDVPPGFVPAGYLAKAVGEKVVTPNGLIYEPLELGTLGSGPRDGPPRSGSTVEVKFVGHVDGFDGPVFDSTILRGRRKPAKDEFIEVRLNLDPLVSNGIFEALKLMKVGGKGRFVQPPKLSYGEGKASFEGDDDGEVKKVPANATLFYEIELVRIIKP